MTSPTPAPTPTDTTTGGSMATGCGAILAMLVLVLVALFAIQKCSSGGSSPPAEVRTEDTSAPPVTSVPSTTVPETTSSTGTSAPPTTAPPVLPPVVAQPDTPPGPEPSTAATPTSPPTSLVLSRTYTGNGDALVTVERPIVAGTSFYCVYTGGRQFGLRVGTEVLVSAPIGNWTGEVTYQGSGSSPTMEVRGYGDWQVTVTWRYFP